MRFECNDAEVAVARDRLRAAADRVDLELSESLEVAGFGEFDHVRKLVAEALVRLRAEIRQRRKFAFDRSRNFAK